MMTKFRALLFFLRAYAIWWLLRALAATKARARQIEPQSEQVNPDPVIVGNVRSTPEPTRNQCDSEAAYQSALEHWQRANNAPHLN